MSDNNDGFSLPDGSTVDSTTLRTVTGMACITTLVLAKWVITGKVESETMYMVFIVIAALAGIDASFRR